MDLIFGANHPACPAVNKVLLSLQRIRTPKVLHSLLLTHLPRFLKYIVYLLLFLNVRSFPFAWHLRVFRPVVAIRLSYLMVKLRTLFMSRRQSEGEEDKWVDNICPVGQDPFTTQVSYYSWASFDDSDGNMHLSNSSYAKTCDAAGLGGALKVFPMLFHLGGYMALAATHFEFIKEIPILASYEVRVTIGSWDQKWMYMICKFVTKPSKESKQIKSTVESRDDENAAATLDSRPFAIGLNTPEDDELTLPFGAPASGHSSVVGTDKALDAISTKLGDPLEGAAHNQPRRAKVLVEPDGAILHAIAVCRGCFKIGRITVPPALVLAINGFSAPPAGEGAGYSRECPPPAFLKVKELMSKQLGGSPSRMREFLKGGWRGVLEEKWWEDALCGSIEERRKKELEVLNRLRIGFEEIRR
ncbi:hypothetical protein JOM56_013547 [Amanita muscaria]